MREEAPKKRGFQRQEGHLASQTRVIGHILGTSIAFRAFSDKGYIYVEEDLLRRKLADG